jgi:hypothetical protein
MCDLVIWPKLSLDFRCVASSLCNSSISTHVKKIIWMKNKYISHALKELAMKEKH